MSRLLTLIFIISSFCLSANGGVKSVEASVKINGSVAAISETIYFEIPDSVRSVVIKALPFEGSQVFIDSLKLDHELLSYEVLSMNPIILLRVPIGMLSSNKLTFHYRVKVKEKSFFLPLFFSELHSLNSDTDFFAMEIIWSQNENYTIHFPKVPMKVNHEGNEEVVSFQLPAAPSLIRMEMTDGKSGFSINQLIDISVGVVFLIIGFVLWIFRKKLAYG
jgi:hypothetical protein